jgi:hypothetical protein
MNRKRVLSLRFSQLKKREKRDQKNIKPFYKKALTAYEVQSFDMTIQSL